MKAIHIINPGPDSRLEIQETESPMPGPEELLVRVHATALNRADLMQRNGNYPPPPGASEILGLEMAGTVEGWGSACTDWQLGERVLGLLPGGGYAEYVVIPQSLAMRMPAQLSFEEAAAIPEVFLTAYQALYWLGELKAEESALIHAGGSGVGTAAIQMAKQTGANVIVTASSAKHEVCLGLGADLAIDYKREAFDKAIHDATNGQGVNLIVDFIGAPYFQPNIASLCLDGRLVLLAMMKGSEIKSTDLMHLFRKRIHVKASTLRSRSLDYKAELTKDFEKAMMPLFKIGEIKPVIDSIFDWRDVNAAHARMAANLNSGKVVLQIK